MGKVFECYGKKLLRVDLTTRSVSEEPLRDGFLERWVGGMGFGTKLFTQEVPVDAEVVRTQEPTWALLPGVAVVFHYSSESRRLSVERFISNKLAKA